MTDSRPENLGLWKVQVLCEGLRPNYPGKKKVDRIERRYTTVLVQAPDGNSAMEAGKAYADSNAAPDIEWKNFTSLNAARFVLPMAVEDLR